MSICYDVRIHFIGCVWENNEPKERQKAMNRKIWKALGIAVCMLALAAPRAMAETKVHTVTADTDFAKVVKTINASNVEDENVIELCADITLTGEHTLKRNTTIKSKDKDHKISIEGSNAGITVTREGTVLNLGEKGYDKKLTIEGDGDINVQVAFITVSGGATANMYEHVTLQNRESTGNAYVLVTGSDPVTGSKSVFNMKGGVIEGGSRAVIAKSGATFNMSGGEIRNCKGDNGGGVHVYGATFVMSGGTINGCSADTGGGLYATNQSTITINKGTISGCTAEAGGGLYADNSTVTISGGTISGCTAEAGGGLYVDGSTVTISGGAISECTARNNGGGLYVDGSTVTISGGAISECTARNNGGGLYAINSSTNSSTVNISGGIISGCTADTGAGGGLYATNSSIITISGGTISGCKAPSSEKGNGSGLYANHSIINISGGTISGCKGRWGGGLYAENSSTIEISGGTISRCEVGAGGGLFVNGSTLTISGGTISECSTTLDTGKGGGLYAENYSILTISGGTIENNEAAHGGGVALTNSKMTVTKPIRNWMVDGNKAYKTGGGIWLGEYVDLDISDRTNRIYNNHAIEHGADICLERGTSAIKLPIAANMYHDSSINIDNWYKDDNPRHKPSESGQVVEALQQRSGPLSLVASYKADPVRIEIKANGGVGGSSSQTVQKGTTVILEAPTKEGHLFTGWKDEKGNSYPAGEDGKVKITVNENMTLTAVWEVKSFKVTYVLLDGKTRTETSAYGKNVTLVEEPRTGYTFVGWKDGEKMRQAGETITVTGDMTLTAEWKKLPSAENLPKTGDESPVLLWGAALAVSAAACFMLRRRK